MAATIQDLLWLLFMEGPGIGHRTAMKCYKQWEDPLKIWQAGVAAWKEAGLSEGIIRYLEKGPALEDARKRVADWEQQGITLLSISSELYPAHLRSIFDPPPVLFALGDTALLSAPMMAVVGARRCSSYGEQAASYIGAGLARRGYAVISGMAAGIDAAAHQGALKAGGRTVAVMGCGIDVCYPPENLKLWREIRETGLILAEHEPGVRPQAGFFPQRNRIISGLSRGVIVVEAGEKSGSLITADLALEQGRSVYAVPGSFFSLKCRGTHALVRDSAAALLVDLGDIEPAENGLPCSGEVSDKSEPESEEERAVLRKIAPEGTAIEELLSVQSDIASLQRTLSMLELYGFIRQGADHKWVPA